MHANSFVKPLVRDADPPCGIFLGFRKHSVCHSNQINGSRPSTLTNYLNEAFDTPIDFPVVNASAA